MLHLCCKLRGSWIRTFPSRIGYIVAKLAMNTSQDHLPAGEFMSASRPHFGQSNSFYCFPIADACHGYSDQAETQWKFSNMICQHKTIAMEFWCQSRSEAVSRPRSKSGRQVDINQYLLSDNIAHRKSYR